MTMYWLTKYSTVRIAVLALYVLASIGVGFAHKNPYVATGDLTISALAGRYATYHLLDD